MLIAEVLEELKGEKDAKAEGCGTGRDRFMKYADIIIDISHEKLDKTFQYRIPPELEAQVTVGTQVWIPFGNGNRKIRGYVVELSDHPKVDAAKIKEIAGLPKDSVTIETQLIALRPG